MRSGFRLVGIIGVAGALVTMLSGTAAAAVAVMHSSDFAGYTATTSAGIKSFSGQLNVPAITCPTSGTPSIDASVQLSGSLSYFVGFDWSTGCNKGKLGFLSADAIFCPAKGGLCEPEAQVNAAPRDSLQFSMTENASTSTTTVTVTNVTEKQTASASVHALLSEPGIFAGTFFCCANSAGHVTPIPSFTPITFGDLKFNGTILSKFKPTGFEMYDNTTLQVATSAISAAGSFTNTFKHA